MVKSISSILTKFQTTVPPSARDAFDLREGDQLEWEFDNVQGVLIVRPMRATLIPPKGQTAFREVIAADKLKKTKPVSASAINTLRSTRIEQEG